MHRVKEKMSILEEIYNPDLIWSDNIPIATQLAAQTGSSALQNSETFIFQYPWWHNVVAITKTRKMNWSQFATIGNKQRQHRQHFNPPEFDGFGNQTKRLTLLNRIAIQQMRILEGVKLI